MELGSAFQHHVGLEKTLHIPVILIFGVSEGGLSVAEHLSWDTVQKVPYSVGQNVLVVVGRESLGVVSETSFNNQCLCLLVN